MKPAIIALQTILISSLPLCGSRVRSQNTIFRSNGKNIRLEVHCGSSTPALPAAVIFLHGLGGESANLPHTDEEKDLAKRGYCVYMPHYLDSTGGISDNPQKQYPIWVKVVEDTASLIYSHTGTTNNRIALVGYSLGASVALAVGAKDED
jgi:pimeloyl-ACP methyl ester carboxylesterase